MATERPEFILPDFLMGTSPEDFQERMMNELPKDIDNMPGGFPYDMTMPTALVASELCNFYLIRALMIALPQYAWGEWLDMHGEVAHVKRHAATYATGEIKITGDPGVEIPMDRIFSTVATSETAAIEFRTTKMVRIGAEGYVMAPIQAILPGKASNVVCDTILMQNKPLDGIKSVTNPKEVQGGTEIESDLDYSERIQLENESESFSNIGNDSDLKRWAQSVDGIKTCIVLSVWNGPGTIKLILVDSNGSPANEELCRRVYNHIVSPDDRSKRLLPAGSGELTVVGAEMVEFSYTCTGLQFDDHLTNIEQIKQDFKEAIEKVYLRAKDLGKFIYHQAESIITDLPGVQDYQIFLVNGKEEDISLSIEEYPNTNQLEFS